MKIGPLESSPVGAPATERKAQPARVRTESGRIVVGTPVGERRVEIRL